MATEPSAVIAIPPFREIEELVPEPKPPAAAIRGSSSSSSQTPAPAAASSSTTLIIDKTLASTANLVKLLPSGTVLFFEALSSSFTNRGDCYASNKFLTVALICLSAVSCVAFSFTDSFVGRAGKHYYGVATPRGFYVFNRDDSAAGGAGGEGEGEGEGVVAFDNLESYRVRPLDYVHALLSALVFLTLAFSDTDVQGCFFSEGSANTKQLVENLPLGAAVLATLVFVVFPTTRKGIGYTQLHTNPS